MLLFKRSRSIEVKVGVGKTACTGTWYSKDVSTASAVLRELHPFASRRRAVMLAALIRQSKELALTKKKTRNSGSDEGDEGLGDGPVTSKDELFAELKQMNAQDATDLLEMFNMFWINLRGYFDDVRDVLCQEGYIKLFTLLQFTINDRVNEEDAEKLAKNDYSCHIKKYLSVDETSFYDIILDFILAHTQKEDLYFYTCFMWALMDAVMFLDVNPPRFKPRRAVEFLFANPSFEAELTVNFVKIKHSPEYALELKKTNELYHKLHSGTLKRVKNVTKSRNTKAKLSNYGEHELTMLEAMGNLFKNHQGSTDTDSDSEDGDENHREDEFSDSASGRGDKEGRGFQFGRGANENGCGRGRIENGGHRAHKIPKVSRNDRSYFFFANQGEGSDSSYVAPVLKRKQVDLSYLRRGPVGVPEQKKEFHGTLPQDMAFSKSRSRFRVRGAQQATVGCYLKSSDFFPSLEPSQELAAAVLNPSGVDTCPGASKEGKRSKDGSRSPDRASEDNTLALISREKVARLNEKLSDNVMPSFLKITKTATPSLPSSPSQSTRLPPLSPTKEKEKLLPSFVLTVKTASKAPDKKPVKPPPQKPVRRSVLEDGKSMSEWIGQSLNFIKHRYNIATPAEDFSHHPFIVGRDCFRDIIGGQPGSGDIFYDDSTVATTESLETMTTMSDFPMELSEDLLLGNQQTPFLNNRRTDFLFQELLEKKRNDLVRFNKLLHPLYTENNSIKIEVKKTTRAKAAEIKYPLYDLLFSLNKREMVSKGERKSKSKTDRTLFLPKKENFVSATFPSYSGSVSNHAKLVKLAAFSDTLRDMVEETDLEEIDFKPYQNFFMIAGTDDFQNFQNLKKKEKKNKDDLDTKVDEAFDVEMLSPSVFHTFIIRNRRGDDACDL